jgi:hypothetical protein
MDDILSFLKRKPQIPLRAKAYRRLLRVGDLSVTQPFFIAEIARFPLN